LLISNIMIGITVSTNYSDILPFVLEANLPWLEHWIIATDYNDVATQELLSNYPKVTVVLHNFKNQGKKFDKGGGMAIAQQYAYVNYPDAWYLVLDSDIVLPKDMQLNVESFDSQNVYGLLHRVCYRTASGYRRGEEFEFSDNQRILGYFQLYKQHFYYQPSDSAADCDDNFIDRHWTVQQRVLIKSIVVGHLGHHYQGWNGRELGSDFLID
jgi:hypothetical protein